MLLIGGTFLAVLVSALYGIDRLVMGVWTWPLGPRRPRPRRRIGIYFVWAAILFVPSFIPWLLWMLLVGSTAPRDHTIEFLLRVVPTGVMPIVALLLEQYTPPLRFPPRWRRG